MASVYTLPGGTRRVQFVDAGRRRTVHLGRVPRRHADSVRCRVDAILLARRSGQPIDGDTAAWLGSIGDDLHRKLARVGLVRGRQARTLGGWIELFIESREGLKPESLRRLRQTGEKLLQHFKADRPLAQITPEDASRWRDGLARGGLSEATVKSHVGNAKTMLAEAVRREILPRSPFAHLKGGVTPTRNTRYVTPEETERLLAAAPDDEWRLLIGLARLAGLRTPSETAILTWDDIDRQTQCMRVRSPKTERHPGHEQREVPIVPRLWELMEARRASCPRGERRLVTIRSAGGRRRPMVALMDAAGVERWAGTWQTLRRSCEIEWAQTCPQYAVSRWIGHSIVVSGRHYANAIPAELIDRVTGRAGPQIAAPGGSRTARVTQIVTQHTRAGERTDAHVA